MFFYALSLFFLTRGQARAVRNEGLNVQIEPLDDSHESLDESHESLEDRTTCVSCDAPFSIGMLLLMTAIRLVPQTRV